MSKAGFLQSRARLVSSRFQTDNFTPALYNTAELAKKVGTIFRATLGDDKVHLQEPLMGGEDFSRYARENIPSFFFFLGTLPPERMKAMREGKSPPISLHSDLYYPTPEPSMRTGILSMSMTALHLLKAAP